MADACLPEHILHEIFTRMPTKPLVRLKCLSKHWNRLISDPYFMKSRSRRMIFLPSLPFHTIDNTNDMARTMIKLCSPFSRESYREMTILGSFNGILILVLSYSLYDHFILYNPFLGKFKEVPDPITQSLTCVYGFGYGTTADDLKIVRLNRYCNTIEVFSLKAWSWSMPSNLNKDIFNINIDPGTFVNEFLYWIAGIKILFLDMKKMVFSEIDCPNKWMINLGTYNSRLCMMCENNMDKYELWVMKEHGIRKSWSMACLLKLDFGLYSHFLDYERWSCILDDGKLLILKSSKQLIIYDMFEDSYKEVNTLMSFGLVGRLQAVEYVESSLSPSDICSI
ncbi:F-box/kelch-repeat protein At3g06240-like [Bidens hawaiensis]|uniref:F-box/kelch-repeat protein At3g06240-like n=1 Tax=Bidens hawaiensis TaxID=980011 RepID=UPI00404B0717